MVEYKTFKITDPNTGNVVKITGESAPSESEINEIFSSVGSNTELNLPVLVNNYSNEPEKIQSVDERIEERGTAFFKERSDEWMQSSGVVDPLLKGLKVIDTPRQRTEAAISNAMLAAQEGRFDDIVDEFKKGAKGEKLGEIGDVFRNSGIPIMDSEPVAATAGFLVSMVSPLALIGRANKALRGLLKSTDKKVLVAGKNLLKGADDAVNVIGRNLNKAYSKVDDVAVDGIKLINSFDDAPKLLVKNIEKELGRGLDDLAQNVTVKDIRKIKGLIGEVKPTSFGKEAKGLVETIETKNINKTYSKVKKLIQETLQSEGLSKEAEHLLRADEAFTDTINASKFIKKAVTESTLLKPTQGGKIAMGLVKEGDISTRLALTTLRGAGGQARKNINQAIDSLNKYNRHLSTISLLRTTGKAALFGGAVGAVGGKVASKVMGGQ
jgi:hypothetical protein